MSRKDQDSNVTERHTVAPVRVSDGPGHASDACLVVLRGQHLGHRVDIGERPIVIGRSPQCDFQITERSVSRQHARIWRTPSGCRISDLGSTNRILLNDATIDEATIVDGDLVTIGGTVMKFMESSSVEARYHDEIYRLATIDPLTGLANRRHFYELAERESARASSSGRALAVLVLDLDHFKLINDLHGHAAGDVVLRQVAEALHASVPESALAARVGGEEFAVLLPETRLDAAAAVAERVRKVIAGLDIGHGTGATQVTASIGAAEWASQMKTFADLMQVADAQLYVAKQSGRNRISAQVDES